LAFQNSLQNDSQNLINVKSLTGTHR